MKKLKNLWAKIRNRKKKDSENDVNRAEVLERLSENVYEETWAEISEELNKQNKIEKILDSIERKLETGEDLNDEELKELRIIKI